MTKSETKWPFYSVFKIFERDLGKSISQLVRSTGPVFFIISKRPTRRVVLVTLVLSFDERLLSLLVGSLLCVAAAV